MARGPSGPTVRQIIETLLARDTRTPPGGGRPPRVAAPAGAAGPEAVWQSLRSVLDEELHRLPARYRFPLVLHYLQGKPVAHVAAELGWPAAKVTAHLARARAGLRARLRRRGVGVSARALAAALSQHARAGTPSPPLVRATARAMRLFVAGRPAAPGVGSAAAAALARGVLRALP
jgi:hypothetical protein